MLFNSWQFAVFLPIVFALYWSLPHRFRWFLILIASYYFYMSWNVKYVVLILFTTIVSYWAAILIERFRQYGKMIMITAVIMCLGVLFIFKYFNFISQSVSDFLNMFAVHLHPMTLKLMLPVGISFYTFQTLSYVIDVYRGTTKAERHLGIYAAFISFFPQLVAGPIERTNNLLPQIKAHHEFSYEQGTYGLKLIAWGLFKKLCVADVLAVYADKVFADVYQYKGFSLVLAVFFFSIQIYCDFSGYSDIARGSAKLFGIELMENFRSPYFSSSIREFWSRWHISLSTWFRDYVYIPLGGSRVGKFRHYMNLMITFIVSGLWHGANWTFVAWGAVHGLAQILEDVFGTGRKCSAWRVMAVFAFTCAAWVFFRAQNIGEAGYIFAHIFTGISEPVTYLKNGIHDMDIWGIASLMKKLARPLVLFIWDYVCLKHDVIASVTSCKNRILRYSLYFILLHALLLFRVSVNTEFIYFQF